VQACVVELLGQERETPLDLLGRERLRAFGAL
jgi:hypothetical protein